jgi:hypothetical protein
MTQFLTVLVGLAGVALGWLTAGYQRVTEKVIEERRAAYGKLLEAAEDARSGIQEATRSLEVAAVRAELVCSDQMKDAGLIRALVESVSRADFLTVRTSFLTAARTDSSTPRMFVRGLSRKQYRSWSVEPG